MSRESFRPRTAWAFCILTAALFCGGLALVILSSSLSDGVQVFLEERVFHRTFDGGKWLPTILSLLSYPLFASILLAALFYTKLPQGHRVLLLCLYAAGLLVMLAICFCRNTDHYIDSDMGAEIALAKECFLSKSFWPRGWCYSTELRTLNTQLLSAPLFCLTDSWHLVKTLTCLLCLPVLFCAAWFMLKALGIRGLPLRLATSIISICPYSLDIWQFVTLGNYYVPKIAILYVHIALFLPLAFGGGLSAGTAGTAGSVRKRRILLAALYALSFIEGLTSIRYIFVILLPLLTVSAWQESCRISHGGGPFTPRAFLADPKSRLSSFSMLAAAFGYLLNSTLLRKLYTFSIWYETAFGKLEDVSAKTLHDDLLLLMGYNEQVSVMSPAGIANVLLYAFIALLLYFIVRFIFKDRRTSGDSRSDSRASGDNRANSRASGDRQSFYIVFSLTSIVLSGFLYLHVKYIARYFILGLALVPAAAAIIIEGNGSAEKRLPRRLLALTGAVFVLTNTFTTLSATFSSNVNEGLSGVIEYLEDSGMDFGYSVTPYPARLAFLMDGRIDFATVFAEEEGSATFVLPEEFRPSLFLSPKRYYEESFHSGKACFFMVNYETWELSRDNSVFGAGKLAYDDGEYRVYTYPSPEVFVRSFGK